MWRACILYGCLQPPLQCFWLRDSYQSQENLASIQKEGEENKNNSTVKQKGKMSLTDLFLSAFPVAAPQGQLSKARLSPMRITRTAGQPSLKKICLSLFISWIKKKKILEPKQAPGVPCVQYSHVMISFPCLYKTSEKKEAKVVRVPKIGKGNSEALPEGRREPCDIFRTNRNNDKLTLSKKNENHSHSCVCLKMYVL